MNPRRPQEARNEPQEAQHEPQEAPVPTIFSICSKHLQATGREGRAPARIRRRARAAREQGANAILHACSLDARSALATLALLLLVAFASLLFYLSRCTCSCSSSFPLLLLLLLRLRCLTLSRLSRFPFHDSQVYF